MKKYVIILMSLILAVFLNSCIILDDGYYYDGYYGSYHRHYSAPPPHPHHPHPHYYRR